MGESRCRDYSERLSGPPGDIGPNFGPQVGYSSTGMLGLHVCVLFGWTQSSIIDGMVWTPEYSLPTFRSAQS